MRLLKTDTLEFVEFDRPPRQYAVLSHRWSTDEVSYEDFVTGKKTASPGYEKIQNCCALARSAKHDLVWIDTCCIDKRSSAELSEAINSMWDWYSQATECLALLSDVHWSDESREVMLAEVESSEWFRRGWTLQELLAPRVVTFFSSRWRLIGRKHDPELLRRISRVTRIPESCLASGLMIHTKSVAERLSWAAARVTTRPEDSAYSLLGIMGVNMPLLYGEGSRAFLRLQQEIIRQVDDESIFAWRYVSPPAGFLSGILAPDVSFFANSHGVRTLPNFRPPIAITNKGLQIQCETRFVISPSVYVLRLNCEYPMGLENGSYQQLQQQQQQQYVSCTLALRADDKGHWYRVGASRLGQHLEAMYKDLAHRNHPSQTFYVRLSRWDNVYQPVLASLSKAMIAWRRRRPGAAEQQRQQKQPSNKVTFVESDAVWHILEQANVDAVDRLRISRDASAGTADPSHK